VGPLLLLGFGGAFAVASWNWCGRWAAGSPVVEHTVFAEGALSAGYAAEQVSPPYPVVSAGYGPPRPTLEISSAPLRARALALAVGEAKVALVSLDALSVPSELVATLRARAFTLGFDALWVSATHSHSSFGGYDRRAVAQLAGMGGFRPESEAAWVEAATRALQRAVERLEPVVLSVGAAEAGALVRNRSGQPPETLLTRAVLEGEGSTVAELWIFAAHPTLVPRPASALCPDFPGLLDEREGPVMFLQGAVGNASAAVPDGEGQAQARYAQALSLAARAVPLIPAEVPITLAASRVEVSLPRPDASRLVPWFGRAPGDNLLCESADRTAEVAALRLGPLTLVGLPVEVTSGAAAALLARTGASRILSATNGYLGYLEQDEVASRGEGESKRQYYAPELHEVLAQAAELATRALAAAARSAR
jgi:neutral ceramidase